MKRLLIIGGGPAGNAAALAAAAAGVGPVGLVESDAFGGTCTNRGCIPTKFLLARSEGLKLQGKSEDGFAGEWGRLIAHKNALVKGLSRSMEARCASRGIELVKGKARFVSPHEIVVEEPGGATTRHAAEQFIVATGSSPADLPGAAFDGDVIIDSSSALDLARIPASLAIIGSGAVGAEFATIYARMGASVTLIEAASHLFPSEDPDVGALFHKVYERMGVAVRTSDPVEKVEVRSGRAAVLLRSGAVVEAERALVAVGRRLGSRGLGCDAAGIDVGPRGELIVDDELRTSQQHIRAAGDVAGRMLLAHAAAYMGEFAARRALGLEFGPVPYHSIPWATFTKPEVAGVGLTQDAAARAGLDCVTSSLRLMDSVKARIDRTTEGFVKLARERGSGRLIGATVVGPNASDMIHVLALAIHRGMTVSDLRGFTFVHPSVSEVIGDLLADI